MNSKKEFNQLLQYYKGQLLENPLLEKSSSIVGEKNIFS